MGHREVKPHARGHTASGGARFNPNGLELRRGRSPCWFVTNHLAPPVQSSALSCPGPGVSPARSGRTAGQFHGQFRVRGWGWVSVFQTPFPEPPQRPIHSPPPSTTRHPSLPPRSACGEPLCISSCSSVFSLKEGEKKLAAGRGDLGRSQPRAPRWEKADLFKTRWPECLSVMDVLKMRAPGSAGPGCLKPEALRTRRGWRPWVMVPLEPFPPPGPSGPAGPAPRYFPCPMLLRIISDTNMGTAKCLGAPARAWRQSQQTPARPPPAPLVNSAGSADAALAACTHAGESEAVKPHAASPSRILFLATAGNLQNLIRIIFLLLIWLPVRDGFVHVSL